MEDDKNPNLIHNLDEEINENGVPYKRFFIFIGAAIVVGVLIGFTVAFFKKTYNTKNSNAAKVEKSAGIADKKTFKDSAEGILKEGGVGGEGNFHLLRPGGESQNVYLTSTTVDLSQYVGKKVKVWGQTFSAEKAGWLMDVGLVELQ